jgi:hypothetical protein
VLTVEDRFAIQELYARCYWANDRGDADGWAGSFHDGAVIVHDDLVVEGRAAILEYVMDRIAARVTEPYRNGLHLVTNLTLEEDKGVVRARCYFVRVAQHIDTGAWEARTAGYYEDELGKAGGRWAFTRRTACHELPTGLSART